MVGENHPNWVIYSLLAEAETSADPTYGVRSRAIFVFFVYDDCSMDRLLSV
jgi:hypothetical protein